MKLATISIGYDSPDACDTRRIWLLWAWCIATPWERFVGVRILGLVLDLQVRRQPARPRLSRADLQDLTDVQPRRHPCTTDN